MQTVEIIGFSILASIVYGILHDQVTARICVEYFTVGHPPLFDTTSPTLIGLGWGIVATWWVGLFLGGLLAVAARAGSLPKRSARSLTRPIAVLMAVCATCALASGAVGHLLASGGVVRLAEPFASELPLGRQVPFLTDLWAHTASYGAGFVGGLVLAVHTIASRVKERRAEDAEAHARQGSDAEIGAV